jgi:hypothetical protein
MALLKAFEDVSLLLDGVGFEFSGFQFGIQETLSASALSTQEVFATLHRHGLSRQKG